MLHLKLSFDPVGIDFGSWVWGKLFAIDQNRKIAAKFWHFDVLRLIITDTFYPWGLKHVCPTRNGVYFTTSCVHIKWEQKFDLQYGARCLKLTKNEKICQIFVLIQRVLCCWSIKISFILTKTRLPHSE